MKKVDNPLTIIALFAGIAEVAATSVLPFLSERIQSVFVYFVMIFPILLVSLFFFTLHKKRDALYAPSDFKDENMFLALYNSSVAASVAAFDSAIQEAKFELNVNNSAISADECVSNQIDSDSKEDKRLYILYDKFADAAKKSYIENFTENTNHIYSYYKGSFCPPSSKTKLQLAIYSKLAETEEPLSAGQLSEKLGYTEQAIKMGISELDPKNKIFKKIEKDGSTYYLICNRHNKG